MSEGGGWRRMMGEDDGGSGGEKGFSGLKVLFY